MIKQIAVGSVCVVTLAACGGSDEQTAAQPQASISSSPTPSGPIELTAEQAGERYLKYICQTNAAGDRLVEAGYYDGYFGQPLTEEQRTALKNAAKVNTRAAQALEDPGYVWPADVAKPIETVSVQLYEFAASSADTAKDGEITDLQGGPGKSASVIRLKLGLPPRGKGCGK